ncbi:hypothetical protein LXA43DRAFT_1137207 [Ganoderma leucocontextum]|nr:hypothetical protein LXA43DRAFT_1137207 [Ganoderma leucocontextum]
MEKPDLEVKSVFSCSSAGMHLLDLKWKNITRWAHRTASGTARILLTRAGGTTPGTGTHRLLRNTLLWAVLDDASSLPQVLLCRLHKAVCPRHAELEVMSAAHGGKDELEFREDVLTCRVRWSPFEPLPCRMFVHLKIREELRKDGGRKKVQVREGQADLLRGEDLFMLFAPPLVPLAQVVLQCVAWFCIVVYPVFHMFGLGKKGEEGVTAHGG